MLQNRFLTGRVSQLSKVLAARLFFPMQHDNSLPTVYASCMTRRGQRSLYPSPPLFRRLQASESQDHP